MNLGDRLVAQYERAADDEYERLVVHQASTVAVQVRNSITMICLAILGWVLPGKLVWWSLLLLVPVVGGELLSFFWYRRKIAMPRAIAYPWQVNLVFLILLVVWGTGVGFNTGVPFATAIGGAIGFAVALIVVPLALMHRRERDIVSCEGDD